MSDEPIRPHKPVAAIAVIICIFNGALLYVTSLQFTGDGGMGKEKKDKKEQKEEHRPKYFKTRANKIFYRENLISFEKFCELTLKAKIQKDIPEVWFTSRTENGFKQRVVDFLEENDIIYREISD